MKLHVVQLMYFLRFAFSAYVTGQTYLPVDIQNHQEYTEHDNNNYKLFSERISERVPPQVAIRPRNTRGHAPLETNSVGRYQFLSKRGCEMPQRTNYFVRKVVDQYQGGGDRFLFFASLVENNFDPNLMNNDWGKRETREEVGYIECIDSRIEYVFVATYARQCGVATRLSLLCMVDLDINEPMIDVDLEALDEESLFYDQPDHLLRIMRPCRRIFYLPNTALEMPANPLEGANAFFTAAIAAGYNKMLSFKGRAYYSFSTVKAKKHYNNPHINFVRQFGHDWYFCERDHVDDDDDAAADDDDDD